MTFKNFKPTGGKLLRIQYQVDNQKVTEFMLRGDFFMHPETAITDIEKFVLKTCLDNDFVSNFNKYLESNQIQIFGFTADNIFEILTTNQCS